MDISEIMNNLRNIDIFSATSEEKLHQCALAIKPITFDRGALIIRRGRSGNAFYILVSGSVSVLSISREGKETVLARLTPLTYFGETALMGGAERTATIRADENVSLYMMGREDFLFLIAGDAAIKKKILENAAKRAVKTEKRLKAGGRTLESTRPEASRPQPLRKRRKEPVPLFSLRRFLPALTGIAGTRRKAPAPKPSTIEEQKGGCPDKRERIGKLSLRSLALFTMQLSVMLRAGIPYIAALQSLTYTPDRRLNEATGYIMELVESGNSLSAAIARMPEAFSPFIITTIRINEEAGTLDKGLAELSAYLSGEEKKRMSLAQALIYPFFILLTCIAMVAFLIFYMLPRFMVVIVDSGAPIPPITAALLFITRDYRPFLIGAVIFACILIVTLPFYRTPLGRMNIQKIIYETPILKIFFLGALFTRFSRSLAILTRRSGNIVYALKTLSTGATGYYRLDESLEDVIASLAMEGSTLSEALREFPLFPRLLVIMMTAGEESGEVPDVLEKYAQMVELESESAIGDMLRVIEPVMLLMMGFVVGFIVLAAFMPIFQLLKTL
jgi:type II secretory pathway component PulF/CRP-like cAMP-binding protein